MRFRLFLSHFLVVLAIILIMAFSGYFSLKSVLFNRVESRLKANAETLVSRINAVSDETQQGEETTLRDNEKVIKETIDNFTTLPTGFAWVIDKEGKTRFFPSPQVGLKAFFEADINPRVMEESSQFFIIGEGRERRFIFFEKVPFTGDIVAVTEPAAGTFVTIAEYRKFITYTGMTIVFLSFFVLIFLSRELLKPLFKLQEYSKNLAVGEYIEKASSLKDPDVAPIATVLERLYNQARKDKSLDQNPLSGLPGNKSLYDALFRRIETEKHLAVGFLDGSNFTAYNNKYGFERGDSVIRFMGMTLLNAVKEKGNKDDKIYHLGADRYFFITTPDKVKGICEDTIRNYDKQIIYYYDEEAQSRGYIVSKDKKDNTGEFAFMPICIGVATNQKRPLIHPIQIGHIMGEIRNFLRDQKKSDYLIDRRITDREEEYEGKMAPFTKVELEAVKKEIEEMERQEASVKKEGQPIRELTRNDTIEGINPVDKEVKKEENTISQESPGGETNNPEGGKKEEAS
ncbi:MAG: diguanylate cyclase [Candidatus Eremiobacteraeota bacterium]|nr:diguanylate cyclase [Candidatus Eremiobacteraeota bacterium]